ncbi:hypothetical protein MJ923_11115 [Shewanella sp. 3B26]|jgi:hypothetical protein|uniref:Uncharacterized protein n=1 Tax=Shewanella zhuhaiensis TaxID=2919576 RepID=A0AAJ1BHF2_9GAMM|nr:hypothetical protein [Shewanella zhuhaiensis]MCH4294853.1 hypothetical protein [Shewanella zhuhaiensis]
MAVSPTHIESLLAPYAHHPLSAWDKLRFAFSLCQHKGLKVSAFRGGMPREGYWLLADGQGVFCGAVNHWQGCWEYQVLPAASELTELEMVAVPESQLGFMLVETAHFDHC